MGERGQCIRVVALIEASTITGPAKNLLRFAVRAREGLPDLPSVDLSIVTYCRSGTTSQTAPSNQFLDAARSVSIETDVVSERFRFDIGVIPQLRAIVRRRDPDIIQTHSVKSHFILGVSRLSKGRHWIAFHHGYTAENRKMRLYNTLDRFSLRIPPRLVTVCEPFAQELVRSGVPRSRITVLPNSVDPALPVADSDVFQLRNQFNLPPGDRIVLSIGRLSREKSHQDLISALAILSRSRPDLKFRAIVLGDGPEKANLIDAAQRAAFSDRLIFPGHQRNVQPFYRLADVFVLPSLSEGSPNVLLEALAAGVPIVATRVGGVPETVVHEQTALLVSAGDVNGISAAIERILSDATLAERLTRNGAAEVSTRFSPESYRRSLVEIYRNCLVR